MVALIILMTLAAFYKNVESGVGCGRQAPNSQPSLANHRIINGQEARANSWPWLISQRLNDTGKHFCGGTILRVRDDIEASDIVLTAGHCLVTTENPDWHVVAGLHQQSNFSGTQKRNVEKVVRHSKYVTFHKYDMALLKLNKPINFTDTIRPICLPKQGEGVPLGKKCVSAGWGRIHKEDKEVPEILQQLGMPVHDKEKCAESWPKFDEEVAFCAGALDGLSSTCQGDSGGMMVCRGDDGRWIQYGVVSYGVAPICAKSDKPPVFARVSSFVDWINEKMRELSSLY